MSSIKKPQNDALHEIINVWYTSPKNLVDLTQYKTVNDASFSNINKVFEIYFTPGKAKDNGNFINSGSSDGFKNDLSLSVPLNSEGVEAAVSFMENKRWIVIYEKGNDEFFLLGYKSGLHFSNKKSHGGETSEMAKYDFNFFGDTLKKPVKIANPFS